MSAFNQEHCPGYDDARLPIAAIVSFSGDYRFLSNFWPSPVSFAGEVYPTVEHAYQASKFDNESLRDIIRRAKYPSGAKHTARRWTPYREWLVDERIRVTTMADLVSQKFASDPLRSLLLSTGDATLIEGNTWRDKFWGMCGHPLEGRNLLGKILMAVRATARG